jgi:hypothetical protein
MSSFGYIVDYDIWLVHQDQPFFCLQQSTGQTTSSPVSIDAPKLPENGFPQLHAA